MTERSGTTGAPRGDDPADDPADDRDDDPGDDPGDAPQLAPDGDPGRHRGGHRDDRDRSGTPDTGPDHDPRPAGAPVLDGPTSAHLTTDAPTDDAPTDDDPTDDDPDDDPADGDRRARARRRPVPRSEVPSPLRIASEVCARMLVIAAGLALLIFVVVQLRVVVIPVAIAVLLSALLAPLVVRLHAHRVPRGIATGLVMIGGLAALGGLLTLVVNTLVDGTADLVGQLSISVASLQGLVDATGFAVDVGQVGDQLLQTVQDNRQMLTSGAVSTAATVGEVLAGFALCLFALIFMLHDGARIWAFVRLVAPRRRRLRVDVAGRRAFASLVGYVRATVLVAFVDAAGIGLGLWITGVPLALPLTALVFVGAFVPIVGAVLTGAIAVLIALVANGLATGLVVLAVVLAVQQLESHVLQPLLLGRAVRLHPLAVALAVAAGVVIAGIVGALLAVPLLAVLTAAVRSFVAPHETAPSEIDPLDPRAGNPPAPTPAG